MPNAIILGTGCCLPDRVVTNHELSTWFETSDEWIRQRTGIETRRFVSAGPSPYGSAELGTQAAQAALEDAELVATDIDLIIHATLSPNRCFPGDGVLIAAALGLTQTPALDVRNQCSGFLYSLAIANAFIRAGTYRRILLIGAEVHSTGLDFSDRGRDVAVLFGDGGAAVVVGASDHGEQGVLHTALGADGRYADDLQCLYPSSAVNPRLSVEALEAGGHYPVMNGRAVFKHAIHRVPEVVTASLGSCGLDIRDVDLLIPHQANLRINEAIGERLGMAPDKVFHNIQKYGNTTACSIPLALHEARREGRIVPGSLVVLAGFGSGFTWGSVVYRA